MMIAFLKFAIPAFSQSQDDVVGTWLSEEKDAKVQIYKVGEKYSGKLVWIKDAYEADGKTPKKDSHNANTALRNRPLQDLVMLENFVYADGKWVNGTIYDPTNGKTYEATMKLNGKNLQIRGYIGIAAFGRTTNWTRQ